MYSLVVTEAFRIKYRALLQEFPDLKEEVVRRVKQLAKNPLTSELKITETEAKAFGEHFSLQISSKVRVIWGVDEEKEKIILLTISGLSRKALI